VKIVEYVVTVASCVPLQELCALVCYLQRSANADKSLCILTSVNKLISFDNNYAHIFRETGLLNITTERFAALVDAMAAAPDAPPSPQSRAVMVSIFQSFVPVVTTLLQRNRENVALSRALGLRELVLDLVKFKSTRAGALRIVQQLVAEDAEQLHNDLDLLLELLQTAQPDDFAMRREILEACRRMFGINHRAKDSFREGILCSVSLLCLLNVDDKPGAAGAPPVDAKAEKLSVVDALFRTLTAAMASHPSNQRYLRDDVGYQRLASALQLAGVVDDVSGCGVEAVLTPPPFRPMAIASSRCCWRWPSSGSPPLARPASSTPTRSR
jgi:hypothetical protein